MTSWIMKSEDLQSGFSFSQTKACACVLSSTEGGKKTCELSLTELERGFFLDWNSEFFGLGSYVGEQGLLGNRVMV